MVRLLSALYGLITTFRNWLYDWGVLPTVSCPRQVVAVGNLTAGGTGKTPLVIDLCQQLSQHGIKPAVVSRGYGRASGGFQRVEPGAARFFGDEPSLIRARLEKVPVWVGSNRVALIRHLLKQDADVQIVIADDAFQHRKLKRDLNILVVDVSQPLEVLRLLPWGSAREKTSGAARADAIVLSKVNLADSLQLQDWRKIISVHCRANVLWAEVEYKVSKLVNWKHEPVVALGEYVAIAGLGQPEAFRRSLQVDLNLNIVHAIWFNDHHDFVTADLDRIQSEIGKNVGIVISEKDAVKWRELKHPLLDRVHIAPLEISWRSGKEALYARMADLSR